MSIPEKVGILTLGCKVNQYESEAIAERCAALGLEPASPEEVCGVYIVNTCTVTAEADRKSCQMIRQLHRRNPAAPVIVTGCSAQRNPERIAAVPGVSFVCGNREKLVCADRAAALVRAAAPAAPETAVLPLDGAPFEAMKIRGIPRTRQYIKIEDGCENRCAYCAICDARGPVRSKASADILAEAAAFAADGCREIVLTGIETASYGRDTGERLGPLLHTLAAEFPAIRFRLGSVDPNLFRPDFLDQIAGLSNIAPHFHISMQSGSSRILAAMRRGYNANQAADALCRIREAVPGVMFTTDMIVGFPGETAEDFEQTCRFISENRFLMTHVFPFSPRRGTEAAGMPGQISAEEKHRRVQVLSETASRTRRGLLDSLTGTVQEVLFETVTDGLWSGHTGSFAEVRTASDCDLHGRVLPVRVTNNNGEWCSADCVLSGKDAL